MTEADWNAATIVERCTWLRTSVDGFYPQLTPVGITDWTYTQALELIIVDQRKRIMAITDLNDTFQEDLDAAHRKAYVSRRRKGLLGWLGFRTNTG